MNRNYPLQFASTINPSGRHPNTRGAEGMNKVIYAYVNEIEYEAILQWDEEGGSSVEVIYVLVPDDESERDVSIKERLHAAPAIA